MADQEDPTQGQEPDRTNPTGPRNTPDEPTPPNQVQIELPVPALSERLPDEASPADRRKTEDELRRLTAIVRNTHDAVIIHTLDGDILAWNKGAEQMFGYTEAEALQMNINKLVPPALLPELAPRIAQVATGQLAGSFETQRLTRDAEPIDVWITQTALIDENGAVEAIATTERDITPVKRAEETIRLQQAELAHMSRVSAVGEFAAAMAHEINQPLCAIGTNARTILRMFDSDTPQSEIREALNDIIQDVTRADRVVQGLRNQLRRCKPEYDTIDINEVISGIAPIIEALCKGEACPLHFNLSAKNRLTTGDSTQLQQVLLNLARNGLDAMAQTPPENRDLLIEAADMDDHNLRVSVRDRGQGMSDSVLKHMYEPFFTTKKDGMGMGLTISTSIISAHGGTLWAGRNEQDGCTFHFSLPSMKEDITP